MNDSHGRLRTLPVPAAFIHSSDPRAHGLGCVEQQDDAADHAGRGHRVLADRARVYRVGVQSVARSDHARGDSSSRRRVLRHKRVALMWYFSWILGLGLALTFGVLNAMWYDVTEPQREERQKRVKPQPKLELESET